MVYREHQRLMVLMLRLFDLVVVAGAFFLAIEVRGSVDFSMFESFAPLEPFTPTYSNYWDKFLLILFLWWVLLSWNKMYSSQRGRSLWRISWIIIKVNILGLMSIGAILFFLHEFLVHRTLLLLFVAICTVLLVCAKIIQFSILRLLRRRGLFLKYALIFGTGEDALWLLKQLRENSTVGIRVIGFISDGKELEGGFKDGVPVFGSVDDMQSLLENHVVDEVFITTSFRDLARAEPVLLCCQDIGINARLLVRSLNRHKSKAFVDEFLDTDFICFSTTPLSALALHTKSAIDFFIATVLLIILLPLLLGIGLLVKLDSPGPALFKQKRAGCNGRVFNMYKFRSMVANAENRREEVEDLNTLCGPVFKAPGDPRMTRVGKFLRRTSLDELPQLVNVLTGNMSLVGPRPLPVYEAEKIHGRARRRLSMKPGITGLWQVSARDELNFSEWVKLDLEYIDKWSLLLDLRLLLKTVPALIARRGAY